MFVVLIVSAAALPARLLLEDMDVGSEDGIRTATVSIDMVSVWPATVYAVKLLVVLTLTHGVCFPHALLNGVAFLSGAMLDKDPNQ